nr:DNA terminase packaging enzyme small subunit [uncultured Mediterranean phage uvMED]
MSSLEENMENMLNISVDVESQPIKPTGPKNNKDDQTKDYEYTRGELYSLIDQGQEAVRGALEVAQESGHPRAYEVAVAAMKHVADMTEKLQALHKNMKDLDEDNKGPSKVTNNAMFVGSTSELQKMLKDMSGGKR